MQSTKSELVRLSRPDELKSLLASPGPCLSVYFPASRDKLNPAEEERRWKATIRQIGSELGRYGEQGRDFEESVSNWESVSSDRGPKDQTLVVFRSPEFLYRMWIQPEVRERIVAGPQFFIRPLLPFLADPVFYILALSLNDVRLLRCTRRSCEAVALAEAKTNFDEYMNSAKPDHVLDNRGSAGPSAGSSKGILSGTASDSGDRGEYLAHYFRQIDRALMAALRDGAEPVILAGVDYEVSLYRAQSSFPRLLDLSIHGAPNSLKGGEMHSRALELVERHRVEQAQKVIAEYNHLAGGGRATNRLKEIVTAAHDGRVNKLVLSETLEIEGAMDEATHQVTGAKKAEAGESYDLLNDAAVQTILHAGHVHVAPNHAMPSGSPIVAVFRY